MNRQGLGAFIQYLVGDSLLVDILESGSHCLCDNGFVLTDRLGHAEGNHGAEGQFKGILLPEEVGAAEDKAELKWEFLLAGRVKGRHEALAHDHFLNIIHEDVEVIEMVDELRICVDVLLDLADPVVEVVGVFEFLELELSFGEVLIEFYVEEFEKVGLLVGESAVDFDVVDLGLLEEGLNETGLA